MSDSTTRESGPAEVLVRHPALFLTVGYLMISLLGLSFEWTLFRQFGTNFYYFAEVTGFLMGAFHEPVTFLLSATALLVGWLAYLWNKAERAWRANKGHGGWFLETYRRYAKSRFNRCAPAIFFVGYSVMFIWLHAGNRAMELREGKVASVTVRMADGSEPLRLKLLGTSSRFGFFYKARGDQTVIVPLESIASISAAAARDGS